MKELVKSLFGSKDEQSSEMGAVFAGIATTIRDEDEEQAQAEAEDDKAEATFAPFSETVETDDGTVLYRIVGSEEIAQSDDLQTRNGQGGATSWTELVRGAAPLRAGRSSTICGSDRQTSSSSPRPPMPPTRLRSPGWRGHALGPRDDGCGHRLGAAAGVLGLSRSSRPSGVQVFS